VIVQQYPMEPAESFIRQQHNTDCGKGWSLRRISKPQS
jgi:hypothetical protein